RAFRMLPGEEHIDVVAVLERSGEQLICVSGQLQRTFRALQLSPDTELRRVAEPERGHLLAAVELLGRDEVVELVTLGDGSGHDCASRNRLRLEIVPPDDLRAGCTGRNIATGHEPAYG